MTNSTELGYCIWFNMAKRKMWIFSMPRGLRKYHLRIKLSCMSYRRSDCRLRASTMLRWFGYHNMQNALLQQAMHTLWKLDLGRLWTAPPWCKDLGLSLNSGQARQVAAVLDSCHILCSTAKNQKPSAVLNACARTNSHNGKHLNIFLLQRSTTVNCCDLS